jgi:RNA polymerase sigma factor (sigma-70 family)
MKSAPRTPDDPALREQARRAADACQTLENPDWIFRFQVGDEAARKQLLNCACMRLTQLTRKMLKEQGAGHLEETERVVEDAAVRLYWALGEVEPFSVRDFFLFAARRVRQELLDLARHFSETPAQGVNYATLGEQKERGTLLPSRLEQADTPGDRGQLAAWTDFHSQVEQLPEEERALFDLLWYLEVSPAEAAAVLNVPEPEIKRRWRSARLNLHQNLRGQLPES